MKTLKSSKMIPKEDSHHSNSEAKTPKKKSRLGKASKVHNLYGNGEPKKKKKPNLLYRSDVQKIETKRKFAKKFCIPFDEQEYTHKLQLQRLKNISKLKLQYPSMSKSTWKELVRKRIKAFERKFAFDEHAFIRESLKSDTPKEPSDVEDPEIRPHSGGIREVVQRPRSHHKKSLKNGTTVDMETTDVVYQRGVDYILRLLKTTRNRLAGVSEEQLCRIDGAVDEVQAVVFLMAAHIKQGRARQAKENRYRLLVKRLPHPVPRRKIKSYFTGSGHVPTKLKYIGPTDRGQVFLDYDSPEGLQFGLSRNLTMFGGNTIHVQEVINKTKC